ncbi:hypothetical protein JCM5350_003952, partial [Sporobolomyces pararoseus]
SSPRTSSILDGFGGFDSRHNRSTSLPTSPVLPTPTGSNDEIRSNDTSPRLSKTLAGLGRSVSLRAQPDTSTPSHAVESLGLTLVSLTPSSSRSQPLCGCMLDDKYLLIGTSLGLDFLPIPLPGSLPMTQLGRKKRRETRRPISLIKRTRFRELAVLSERSNVLLAIAGRTDQVRVYPLEGIRSLIERKMAELDIREGYPVVQDAAVLYHSASSQEKGKGKPLLSVPTRSQLSPSPGYPSSPPPNYSSTSSLRHRPPPLHLTSTSTFSSSSSSSPTSTSFPRRGSVPNGSIVREVPKGGRVTTPSTPRTVRAQTSKEFVASRKSSAATIQRRKSRNELRNSSEASTSRRLLPRSGERVDTSELADFLRESGPDEADWNEEELVPQSSTTNRSSTTRDNVQSTPSPDIPSVLPPRSTSVASSLPSRSPDWNATPRNRKRWTIGGSTPLRASGSPASSSTSPDTVQAQSAIDRHRRTSLSDFSAPRESRSGERRSVENSCSKQPHGRTPLLDDIELPPVPLSSQLQEPHELSAVSSPVEYVKLARTRGARLFRAVETERKTYLAVLCGEEGERIELFTGFKNISLSLNRTFVLPDTPRTIDFQLQGDDLIDIYLIYSQSIFALEPSTVRVREVGVGRRSQRPRGRAASPSARTEETPPSSASLDHTLLPLASPRQAQPVGQEEPDNSETAGNSSFSRRPPPSPVPLQPTRAPISSLRSSTRPQPDVQRGGANAPSSSSRRGTVGKQPYRGFTQLGFIPPLPSSLLSSQWTIPPLYRDVVAKPSDSSLPPPDTPPLLSPVSLLGGAALRNNVRPGLFFVSRGASLTGIVTADGKSIIKNPISWSSSDPSSARSDDHDLPQHVEVLVAEGKRTIVFKISCSEVKAVLLEEGHSATTLVPAAPSTKIQFLSTHSASQQLFFSETTANGAWTIRCIGTRSAS